MRLRSTRTIVAAVAGAALLAGGATALAGSGSPSSPPSASHGLPEVVRSIALGGPADCKGLPPKAPFADPLQTAATYLGLSLDQLLQELQSGKSLAEVAAEHGKTADGLKQAILDAMKSRLDAAVAAGDLTAEQAQQILAKLQAQAEDIVAGKGRFTIKIEGGPGSPVLDGPLATAASYLGLSDDELVKELQAGKSLAEVAAAHGKSADSLEQAIFDAEKARIQEAIHALVNQKGLPGPECGAKLAMGAAITAPALGSSGTP
jgi:hypothetical protein